MHRTAERGWFMVERWIVFGTLAGALVLFVRGPWRYDLVALMALLVLSVWGIVPAREAFGGFAHPAVVTVAAVLVISAGLRSAGVVNLLGGWLERAGQRPGVQVIVVTVIVAVASGFMNNVGALAILMPATIQLARSSGRSPSYLLMPLAFGSLLGGLVTLIGTPPNIIIATFRADAGGEAFAMFDFAPVGAGVALIGVAYISLLGWRLIPARKGDVSPEELFEIDKYTAELRVPEESEAIDMTVRQLGESVDASFTIVGLARGSRRIAMPPGYERLSAGDILLVEGNTEAIQTLSGKLKLELAGNKERRDELLKSDSVEVVEAIVQPDSYIEHRSAYQLNLRRRYGMNLLGVARQGYRLKQRLQDVRFQAGDILLLQGDAQAVQQSLGALGLLPLAARGLQIGRPRRLILALGMFVTALGLTAAGVLPVQIALICCAVGMVLTKMLTVREAYHGIDWPIVVLLGAMIPVGGALESTGGAQMIADGLGSLSQGLPVAVTLGVLLVGTSLLSDVINNAASAVLMAPIAVRLAEAMSASMDPFLMVVALGASSSFLTPIGHQSNTLVLGPGGYRFGDYFRVGFPLSLITWAAALPLVLFFWPPYPAV